VAGATVLRGCQAAPRRTPLVSPESCAGTQAASIEPELPVYALCGGCDPSPGRVAIPRPAVSDIGGVDEAVGEALPEVGGQEPSPPRHRALPPQRTATTEAPITARDEPGNADRFVGIPQVLTPADSHSQLQFS
jgi:hypothetical protein